MGIKEEKKIQGTVGVLFSLSIFTWRQITAVLSPPRSHEVLLPFIVDNYRSCARQETPPRYFSTLIELIIAARFASKRFPRWRVSRANARWIRCLRKEDFRQHETAILWRMHVAISLPR